MTVVVDHFGFSAVLRLMQFSIHNSFILCGFFIQASFSLCSIVIHSRIIRRETRLFSFVFFVINKTIALTTTEEKENTS